MSHSSRGRHGAPSTRRWLARRSRPACGPIPQLPCTVVDGSAAETAELAALDLPSMDLPEGHMRQRPHVPGPVYVGTVLERKRSRFYPGDVVKVVRGIVHVGRRGIVVTAYGNGRPLVVEIDGGQVYLDEDQVELVRRPADADTEQFANVHVAVPVTVVTAQHADGTPTGYWLPGAASQDAPTEPMAAVDEDDMVLIGGAR